MGYFKDWWKSLFCGSGETDELGFPVMKREDIPPIPEVKPCKPEKDISEPVLSFIKLYKENPKRFKVKREVSCTNATIFYKYSLLDTVNKKLFTASKRHYYMSLTVKGWELGVNTGWATQDEMQEVFDVILEERESRYKALKDKKHSLQRERLTKLYKGE